MLVANSLDRNIVEALGSKIDHAGLDFNDDKENLKHIDVVKRLFGIRVRRQGRDDYDDDRGGRGGYGRGYGGYGDRDYDRYDERGRGGRDDRYDYDRREYGRRGY